MVPNVPYDVIALLYDAPTTGSTEEAQLLFPCLRGETESNVKLLAH